MKKRGRALPSVEQLESELYRIKRRKRYGSALKNAAFALVTVASVAVLVALLWLPMLEIYGNSMTPTLQHGEIVFSMKTDHMEQGDIIAFYYNNQVLVKRVIAGPGDWVDLDQDGTVFVNDVPLEEPYLTEKAYGETNIELPYQVPDGKYFVMGDHRSTSLDSRNTSVGCITEDQIVGRILLKVWPLTRIGMVD